MKLALGTVQFGLDYGVSNQAGKVSPQEIEHILATCQQYGIHCLDTAAAYGESEQVLGTNFSSQTFDIVTKIPSLAKNKTADEIDLTSILNQSLKKLKRKHVRTLLLHDGDDLISHPKKELIYQQITALKKQGLVQNIGVSVYSPQQLTHIIQQFAIDAVQLPLNLLDQRFLQNDLLTQLQQKNITIHTRSAFLQGLLLMSPFEVDDYFLPYQTKLLAVEQLSEKLQCSKLTLALAMLAQNSLINNIVVGCCSSAQLDEIIKCYQQAKSLNVPWHSIKELACETPALINPSLWKLDDSKAK